MTATPTALTPSPERQQLQRRARWLLRATIVWNSVEAFIAVGAGVAAGSIALMGFGLDSLVEVFAATVAAWQLRGRDEERETRALRLIALSFFGVATFVVVESIRDVIVQDHAATSVVGIVLASVSLAVMPGLAIAKRRVAGRLGSATLTAEAAETMLCASLSAVLLVGLVVNATLGWWWADTVAALVIAALAIREGREAWDGGNCGHHTGVTVMDCDGVEHRSDCVAPTERLVDDD